MTLAYRFSGFALAALTLAGGLAFSQSAKAEDLVDFLWGGSAEYGGGRSEVGFDPQYKPNQIIVSFSDRRLYLIDRPGHAITYPVAVPMGEARWQGVTFVSEKKVNPSWTPTPDMMRNNPKLPHWVPGGHPMNPLGIRAMYLGSSAYRIHGTDAPWTIGQAVSHGCIRMTNDDVLDLYPRVPVGMRVTVTWQRFSTSPVASSGYSPTPTASYASTTASSSSYAANEDSSSSGKSPSKKSRTADDSLSSGANLWDEDRIPAPAPDSTAPAPAPKKKSVSAAIKKKTATASSTAPASSAPATPAAIAPSQSTTGPIVPDPVKASTSEKSTDATPTATNASASATDVLPVEKASISVR